MTTKDTDALYYPYINIRDINWLKSTLLCFPHVLRMIPGDDYRGGRSSNHFIDELGRTRGARGQPLLGTYYLDSAPIAIASEKFAQKLRSELTSDNNRLHHRLSRESARDFGRGDDSFYQIHSGKFTGQLIEMLRSENLMWQPDRMHGDRFDWWAVHPLLGEALMSTFASAAARDAGCEIVTDDPSVHFATLEADNSDFFDELVNR